MQRVPFRRPTNICRPVVNASPQSLGLLPFACPMMQVHTLTLCQLMAGSRSADASSSWTRCEDVVIRGTLVVMHVKGFIQ